MALGLNIDGTDLRPSRAQFNAEEALEEVFQWQAAAAYAYYLLDLPGLSLNVVDNNVGRIAELQHHVVQWRPYDGVLHPSATMQLSAPATMQALPPRYQICVALDSLGVLVPITVANVVSGGFAVGLVTRLMLRRFGDRSTGEVVNELDVIARTPMDFIQNYGTSAQSFQQRYSAVAQANSVQASGIFLGWNAGGKLDTAPTAVADAIWKLLHARFGWQQLGELTAYGLSYCNGFAHVQSALRAAQTPIGHGQQSAPDRILSIMKTDNAISDLEARIVDFFDRLAGSFVDAARHAPSRNPVANFGDYLRGYQRGALRGASEIFDLTLKVSYGLGYEDGFRVGYAKGYSDGYKAGYEDGQDINWGSVLHDVATVVDDAATVIAIFA